jgi:LytTr DNA-binding domain
MTDQTYINIGKINFPNVYKLVGVILFFSVLMTLLFQMSTTGLCHSKATLIFFYNLIFWGVTGYNLFYLTEKGLLNMSLSVLIGMGTLFINQLIIGYGVEWTMLAIYDCGSITPNWINYLISNNALTNLLCFIAFTGGAGLMTKNNIVETPHSNDWNEVSTSQVVIYPEEISIKDGTKQIRIAVAAIRYIEVEKNCITVHTQNGQIVLYQSLKSFTENLDPELFVRSHRSYLVNLIFVDHIVNLPSGDAVLVLKTGEKLKMSRTFKANFIKKIHAS